MELDSEAPTEAETVTLAQGATPPSFDDATCPADTVHCIPPGGWELCPEFTWLTSLNRSTVSCSEKRAARRVTAASLGISLTLHAIVLGLLACCSWHHFDPPRFAIEGGGGAGGSGASEEDGAPLLEAAFFAAPTEPIQLTPMGALSPSRVKPPPDLMESDVHSTRMTPPQVTLHRVADLPEPAVSEASHTVPPAQLPPRPLMPSLTQTLPAAPSVEPVRIAKAPPTFSAADMEELIVSDAETSPPKADRSADSSRSTASGEALAPEGKDAGQPVAARAGSTEAMRAGSNGTGRGAGRALGGGPVGGSPGNGRLDAMPSPSISNPLPAYPPEALARGVEGLVLLRVWIRDDGSVEKVKLHTSSGDASLDQSALSTVRERWLFQPARQDGFAVPCEVLVPIRFRTRANG